MKSNLDLAESLAEIVGQECVQDRVNARVHVSQYVRHNLDNDS